MASPQVDGGGPIERSGALDGSSRLCVVSPRYLSSWAVDGRLRDRLISMAVVPETRYVRTADGVHIAYQVLGDGPLDLVFVPGWVNHLEWAWEYPPFAAMLRRLGSFSRLIWFDRRGLGLSDRPDRLPILEDQVEDIGAVMEAAGSERAVMFGDGGEGTALAIVYAATHPERVDSLVTFGGRARFIPARSSRGVTPKRTWRSG